MRLFKYTLFFTKMQHLSKEWRDSVNYFCDLKTRPKNLWKRTWSRCRNMDHDEKGRCETTRQRRNERLQYLNPSSRGSNDDDMMMPQHLLGHSHNFNRCSGCRHSWCALHYPFLAMICNHMRGTSVIPSSWQAWYTVVPRAAAPSASGAPGKAPSMKSQ